MTALHTAVVLAMLGGTPDGTVLVFSSKSCGPCQAMAPGVQRLQQQGYAIRKVDIYSEGSLASRFRIERVPTTVLVVGGQERQRYIGYLGEDQLRRLARSIPPRQEPAETSSTATISQSADSSPAAPTTQPSRFNPSGAVVPSVIRANLGGPTRPASQGRHKPLAVCARIRVHDSKGLDIGSGTVIESRPGRTIILTCGHIFRHYDSKGRIEVDLFADEQPRTIDGKLIDFDLKSDVGLISISTLHAVPVANLSAAPAAAGQHVFSIGCGGGDPPTRLQHLVTSTTRYKAGFIECTGTPNQGRSGGGLFSTDGKVLGVCVLADPKARRGLYAGLPAVHSLLNRAGYSHLSQKADHVALASDEPPFEKKPDEPVFESTGPAETVRQPSAPARTELAQSTSSPRTPLKLSTISNDVANNQEEPHVPASRSALPNLTELQKKLSALRGAEVICIVRDPDNPDAESRVIVIHEASDRFIADLTGELHSRPARPAATTVPTRVSTSEVIPPVHPVSLPLSLPLPEPPVSSNQTVRRVPESATGRTGIQRYHRRQ